MSTLTIKNKNVESSVFARDITYTQIWSSELTAEDVTGGDSSRLISNDDLSSVSNSSTYLYFEDVIELQLTESSETETKYRFSVTELFLRTQNYFKMTDSVAPDSARDPSFEISKYESFNILAETLYSSPTKITFKLKQEDLQRIKQFYLERGVILPEFGALRIAVKTKILGEDISTSNSYLVKFTTKPLFSSDSSLATTPSAENTYKTAPYTFENLFIPKLSASFVYNYYEAQEDDYTVYSSRNYAGDPLDQIPKYIKLNWNKPSTLIPALFDVTRRLPEIISPYLGEESSAGSVRIGGATLSLPDISVSEMADVLVSRTRSASDFSSFFDLGIGSELTSPIIGASSPIESGLGSGLIGTLGGGTGLSDTASSEGAASASPTSTSGRTVAGVSFETAFGSSPVRVAPDPFLATDTPALEGSAPVTFSKSDYIGYVIQKTRINLEGEEQIADIIAVTDKNKIELIDWKIAYGETYSYKIRSIFRFVNKNNINIFYDSDILSSQLEINSVIDRSAISTAGAAYYYDSEFSDPVQIEVIEFERPEPPNSLVAIPNSKEKSIFLTWSQKNEDRDIVGFNVYRRTENSSFIKMNSEILDARNNKFIDKSVDRDVEYIYAVESVDFHSLFSKLSSQISCRIVSYNIFSNSFCEKKSILKVISNFELTDEFKDYSDDQPIIVCKNNFKLNMNPLFNLADEGFILLKVTSLDTGLVKEIKLYFTSDTIYHVAPRRSTEDYISLFLQRPELFRFRI